MSVLKMYDRTDTYEVGYIPLSSTAAELVEALEEFGTVGVEWTISGDFIEVSRLMSSSELPAVQS